MAKVIIPPYNGYNTWEYRIADWYAGRPMGTWTDPNIIPLVNNIALGTNSGDYIPEPWWGNHDMDIIMATMVEILLIAVAYPKQPNGMKTKGPYLFSML